MLVGKLTHIPFLVGRPPVRRCEGVMDAEGQPPRSSPAARGYATPFKVSVVITAVK